MSDSAADLEAVLAAPVPVEAPARLSPSRYTGATECQLRVAWAASAQTEDALPGSPAARMGTVLHKMLEMAADGRITDEATFAVRWSDELTAAEAEMAGDWRQRHLVPLDQSDRLFDVRRFQAEARALSLAKARAALPKEQSEPPPGGGPERHFGAELRVTSADDDLIGYIDLVWQEAGAIVIRDYKAGVVTETDDTGEANVKGSYQDQLKLYAALYFESTGKWPDRLEVEAPSGDSYEVSFSREECEELRGLASGLVQSIRETVAAAEGPADAQAALANPAPDVCRFCTFRPYCLPYWEARRTEPLDDWPLDLWGRVSALESSGDGTKILTLAGPDGEVLRVRGLPDDSVRHPALESVSTGELLAAFGLRRRADDETFAAGPLATFYLVQGPEAAAAAGF